MTTSTEDLRLAADFAPATQDDWRKLVDGVLKGAPFEKLVSKTYDGIRIDPIYSRAKGAAPIAGRAAAAPWQIMQRIDHPDAAQANAQALHDLENGATGLTLVFSGANGAHGFGLDPSPEAIEKILDGVILDAGIALELQIGPQSRMAAIHVAELVKRKGFSPSSCDIRLGLDPLGAGAVWGSSPYAWAEIVPAVTSAVQGLAGMGFKSPIAAADGRVVHDAGGSEVQELAFTLAAAVAYLRAIEQSGIALDAAQGMIYARLAADADVFPQHLTEGLSAHQTAELLFATAPQGLYSDLLAQLPPSAHLWGIPPESFGVPAETITAQVNIAPFWEQKLRALRCHRTQLDADHAFTLLTPELATELLPFEYFRAVEVIGAYQPSYERP